jgi:hypothetical protein
LLWLGPWKNDKEGGSAQIFHASKLCGFPMGFQFYHFVG